MFYSQDLLCRRGGRFGTVWLLATTTGIRCRWRVISNREVAGIDIRGTCADIILPPAPLALRLTSTLLVGLAQALNRKAALLYADCRSTRSRMLSTPWVTAKQGFDPTITAASTVASVQAITLPDAFVPAYDVSGWICDQFLDSSSRECTLPFSPGYTSEAVSAVSNATSTATWASISLPDAQMRDRDSGIGPALFSDPGLLDDANSYANSTRHSSQDELLAFLGDGGDESPIHFDNDGNLHYTLTRPTPSLSQGVSVDAHTEVLFYTSALGTAPDIHRRNDHAAPHGSGFYASRHGARGESRGTHGSTDTEFGGNSGRNNNSYTPDRDFQLTHGHMASTASLDDLEAAENDVLLNQWAAARRTREPAASAGNTTGALAAAQLPTRHRNGLKRRQLEESLDSEPASTYERRISDLWSGTCYWHKNKRAKVIAKLNERTLSRTSHHIALNISCVVNPRCVPDICAEEQGLLGSTHPGYCDTVSPDIGPYAGSRSPEPLSGAGSLRDDGHFDFGDTSNSSSGGLPEGGYELELGRATSPTSGMHQEITDQEFQLHLNLDIPWLNPKLRSGMQRRESRSMSIHAESSTDNLIPHQRSSPIEGTPMSRAHSLDLPSSDDGIEIQHFELAANDPEPDAAAAIASSMQDNLDSFLDTSRDAGARKESYSGAAASSIEGEIDHGSNSFRWFVATKMAELNTHTVVFDDLLLPPYNTRRVAARAFVDVLQTATNSIFCIRQAGAFGTISISIPMPNI